MAAASGDSESVEEVSGSLGLAQFDQGAAQGNSDRLGRLVMNHGLEIAGDGGSLLVGHLGGGGLGRIEHGATVGFTDYYIEERLLKAFCSTMSFGYADFKKYLEEQFMVSYMPKKDMTAKTKGPPMRVSVMKISRRSDEEDFTGNVPLVAA